MDGDRFDALARSLATPRSRRAVARALAGSAAGGLLALAGRHPAGADPCKRTGKECKKGIQCCSGSCVPPTDSISTHGSGSVCCPVGQVQYPLGACCTPTTCAAQGKNCGTISDGCGGTLNCGVCTAPDTCGGGGAANVCGCTPTTCAAGQCGATPDGCGGTLQCGECPTGQVCYQGTCCGPAKCAVGLCGTFDDLCGGTVECGCLDGERCHLGICCRPAKCAAGLCGTFDDLCGGTVDCGCLDGERCHQGTCCRPNKCAADACGTFDDGCGGTVDCGCPEGQCLTCTADGACVSTCTGAGQTCVGGECKLDVGAGCTADEQCGSGICAAGTCQSAPGGDGDPCDSDADCLLGSTCSGMVAGRGVCCASARACGSICCANGDQICDRAGECCTATTCAAEGVQCGEIPDNCGDNLWCGSCGFGEECIDNVCQSICRSVTAECATGDVCCDDLICGFDDTSSTSRSCCRPRGSECGAVVGGDNGGCCGGSTCQDIGGVFGGRECIGCDGDFNHVFGGPACTADIQCCSGFCDEASGNCCEPLGAPCSEVGGLSLECCTYLGHVCSSQGCAVCGQIGDPCDDVFGVGTCCLGGICDAVSLTCVSASG